MKIHLAIADETGERESFLLEPHDAHQVDVWNAHTGCKAASGPTAPVAIEHKHCTGCPDVLDHAELVGLTREEAQALIHWRDARARGHSSSAMGEILDKVARFLASSRPQCDTEGETLILEARPA